VLGQSGVTMDTVTAKSKTAANQQQILFDSLAKLGAESGGKDGLDLYTTALVGLNKALQSDAVKEFATGLRAAVEVGIAGQGWQEFALDLRKSFFLVLDGWNNLIKGVSGGKLNIDDQLGDARRHRGRRRQDATGGAAAVGQPVADELSGQGPRQPDRAGEDAGLRARGRRGLRCKGASAVQLGQLGDLQKLIPDTARRARPTTPPRPPTWRRRSPRSRRPARSARRRSTGSVPSSARAPTRSRRRSSRWGN
jgi:hypothetical protein